MMVFEITVRELPIHPARPGYNNEQRFAVFLKGEAGELCRSRTPFTAAARALLDIGGADPADILVMRHEWFEMVCLRGSIGACAGLRAQEGGRSAPHFAPYVEMPAGAFATEPT